MAEVAMKTSKKLAGRRSEGETPDARMTLVEKDSLIEQIEEFEGPSRREKRGTEPIREHRPGVSGS
jgi:hypothetical protein